MSRAGRRLRRFFLVGLVITVPVGVTIWVLIQAFQVVDAILGEPLRAWLGVRVPGLGAILLTLIVTGIGWLVHRAAGRQVLHWWNRWLSRFPLTGMIYNAASQIVQSLIGERRRLFRRTVLIPFPTEGAWAIAFVTNDSAPMMSRFVGASCVNVFVPTTPNPTSGFMLVVPLDKILEVDITVEEAMKLVISAGSVSPAEDAAAVARRGLDLERLLRDTLS